MEVLDLIYVGLLSVCYNSEVASVSVLVRTFFSNLNRKLKCSLKVLTCLVALLL